VGAALSTGVITHITKDEGAIINPVTTSGTIVANGILAASNPYWIAAITIDAPLASIIVNAAVFAVGDVNSIAIGFSVGLVKLASALAFAAVMAKALCSRSAAALTGR